jgi:hypothetical protein
VTRRGGAALALVVVALLAAACTDDGDQGSTDPPTTGPPQATETEPGPIVSMVAVNVLHGLFCPEETDACDAPARLELLWAALEDAGCPDLVGLSEIGPRQSELVPERLGDLCGGRYELVWDPEGQGQELDREMILTMLPVVDDGYVDLAAFPWGAHWALVESTVGPLVFSTTHLASSANNPPCTDEICPPMCDEGLEAATCQAMQLVDALDQIGGPDAVRVISGDLNGTITSPRLRPILDAGYLDVWELAELPECNPVTGEGCTCCIGSDAEPWDGGGLRDATLRRSSRIDFVLVRGTSECKPVVQAGVTAIFAGDPSPEPVDGVLWPSDHAGVVTAVGCGPG